MRLFTNRSTVTEHAWAQDHPINWNEARVLDCAARATELVLKEAASSEGDRLNLQVAKLP